MFAAVSLALRAPLWRVYARAMPAALPYFAARPYTQSNDEITAMGQYKKIKARYPNHVCSTGYV